MQFHTLLILLTVSLLPVSGLLAGVSATRASETRQEIFPGDQAPAATLLPPVMVLGQREPLTDASRTIDRNTIGSFPNGNGSINEILSILPDIQFSETSNLSTQGGEILPPSISISGGKIYSNNFMIDGMSNNNLLDPAEDNLFGDNALPGHPQEIFLAPDLVQKIDVYQNNIPARYGGFTGGVVDAKTIDPLMGWRGVLRYRTTRDSWTRFHIDDRNTEAFRKSNSHENQPEFERHDAGATLHIPLTDHSAALLSYQLLYSKIPLRHFSQAHSQYRRLENFFFKYLLDLSTDSSLSLSLSSSPYESHYFKPNYLNSDTVLKKDAYQGTVEYHKDFSIVDWQLKTAWREGSTTREAPADIKFWAKTPSKSWGDLANTFYSMEGAFGDIQSRQKAFELKNNFSFSTISIGPTSNTISTGLDYQHLEGEFKRKEQSSYYFRPIKKASVECSESSPDCVPDEQYFSRRIVYHPQSTRVAINLYDLYAEDIITLKRLELRPGVRISHDDFMNNLNVAHRIAGAWDLFGNRDTVLVGGINRYYGNTLLTYKLKEEKKPLVRETRSLENNGQPRAWEEDTSYRYKRSGKYSRLKTPFVDEWLIGFDQQLFGGTASFRFAERDGKDEFAKETSTPDEDGVTHYILNNNGYSNHHSYILSWERRWRNHYFQINGTFEKSTASNETYDDTLDENNLDDLVWYDGHVINITDLPRKDFNRPWLINLLYVGQLPRNITFSSLLKYRSGYQALQKSGQMHADLGIPIYQETKLGGATIVDCKIDWRTRLWARQELLLSLEVLNLLDKKAAVGGREDEYEMGRQFWLGAQYFF